MVKVESDTQEKGGSDTDSSLDYKKTESRGTTLSLLAGFVLILVIISVLAYKSSVDPEKIKRDIAGFKSLLEQKYSTEERRFAFDYGDVEIEGGVFEKTIHVKQPTLSIVNNGHRYVVSSDEATLVSNGREYSTFQVALASPITIEQSQKARTMRYVYQDQFMVEVKRHDEGDIAYHIPLPTTSTVEVVHDAKSTNYDITTEKASYIAGVVPLAGQERFYELTTNLGATEVAHDGGQFSFDQAQQDVIFSAEGRNVKLRVEKVKAKQVLDELEPLSIKIDQSSLPAEGVIDRNYIVNAFSVEGNEVAVDVTGKVSLLKDQLMPLVDLKVNAEGAAKLAKSLKTSHIISGELYRIIVNSLTRIAPGWHAGSVAPLSFNITRTATSPFMIGDVKADELVAIALKEYISASESGTAEKTPGKTANGETAAEPMLNGVMPKERSSADPGKQPADSPAVEQDAKKDVAPEAAEATEQPGEESDDVSAESAEQEPVEQTNDNAEAGINHTESANQPQSSDATSDAEVDKKSNEAEKPNKTHSAQTNEFGEESGPNVAADAREPKNEMSAESGDGASSDSGGEAEQQPGQSGQSKERGEETEIKNDTVKQ